VASPRAAEIDHNGHKDSQMPITASINRHPETENQSETAAPHPEEMKATLDLAIGNAVSVKASVRTTPAGLVAAAMLAAAILLPTVALAKTLLRERRNR
jgi:hypothetical protein